MHFEQWQSCQRRPEKRLLEIKVGNGDEGQVKIMAFWTAARPGACVKQVMIQSAGAERRASEF